MLLARQLSKIFKKNGIVLIDSLDQKNICVKVSDLIKKELF